MVSVILVVLWSTRQRLGIPVSFKWIALYVWSLLLVLAADRAERINPALDHGAIGLTLRIVMWLGVGIGVSLSLWLIYLTLRGRLR